MHVHVYHVHIHDVHATVLHLLGIDHTRLTFRLRGRDFRLREFAQCDQRRRLRKGPGGNCRRTDRFRRRRAAEKIRYIAAYPDREG